MSIQVYGKLLDSTTVEQAVQDVLERWLLTYIAEVERQNGIPARSLPAPRSYSNTNEFYRFDEDRLPGIVIVSPGVAPTAPKMDGAGYYRAWWRVGVGAVTGSTDREATRRLSRLYGAAIRGAILQHQTLDGLAEGVAWTNERSTDVPDEQGRTLSSCALTFDIEVREVTNPKLGPLDPPSDPYEDFTWPLADPVDVSDVRPMED